MVCWRAEPIIAARASQLAIDTTYQFARGHIGGAAVLRIAGDQLARLRSLQADTLDAESGFHKTRKCLKRLRALLRLLADCRGAILPVRRANRALRNAGRSLSAARDAFTKIQVLETLNRNLERSPVDRNGHKKPASKGAPAAATPTLSAGLGPIELFQIDRLLEQLPIDHFDAAVALRGIEKTCLQARRRFKTAYRTNSAADFHHLRKSVQMHLRHMQLFAFCWPGEMLARIALARSISTMLGEDHDLSLLAGSKKYPGRNGGLSKQCEERQAILRTEVGPQLSALFAERPGAYRKRLAAYLDADLLSDNFSKNRKSTASKSRKHLSTS